MYHCQVCGKGFDSTRKDAMYCSQRCSQRAYRARKKIQNQAKLMTPTFDEWLIMNAITEGKDKPQRQALYDTMALVKRDKWEDYLFRLYMFEGLNSVEDLNGCVLNYRQAVELEAEKITDGKQA